ncbi:PDZ domain-containing protein [Thiomicrorhabdus sp. zzn3]|uniref:M61 family metallopeptidase n=1 Tax=Thiomicrorhabdus sp. zzn3 TaxID=3039775 RepID=UPI00243646DC|nr:PDZ domain-containing protein [Thiomicrorhabdus sp. zzn3]MDG6778040.1 PDZ domain-containing protein [Thiomicrorhabdus sp. zzn3]
MHSSPSIRYTLTPADPKGHLYEVRLRIPQPKQPVQSLSLPNWIPGSYLIRDFAKHVISVEVFNLNGEQLEERVPVNAVDKSTWEFESNGQPVEVCYQVYAWDLSVRGAHFDETHGFFNGTSVFLAVDGLRDLPCFVSIEANAFCRKQAWKVATGLPKVDTDEFGFGLYCAEDYDALIDYPVEMGTYQEIHFDACGVPHTMVLSGQFECDVERLKQDLIKICETEIKLFGEPAPMDNYLFQVMVTGSDYGGLEHRNSTALICSRDDLPYHGMTEATDEYIQFLELCSHEYFHLWNVKRIQPKVFQQSDLREPAYSNQLWWFEGVTSYYDALILLRAGLIDQKKYLQLLAQQMTRVYRMPGRFKQSVAESSWLAWTKFYQQDENAPNAIISYYTKGSLIALALDLTIRQQTGHQHSLDDVLLHLWHHYGQTGQGLEEYEIERLCSQVTGVELDHFFERYLYGTEDLPFAELFDGENIEFELRPAVGLKDLGGENATPPLASHLGANLADSEHQTVKLTHVWHGQPAYQAGLAAGDEIVAINGLKTGSASAIEKQLKRMNPAAEETVVWRCHYFRRDELRETVIQLNPAVKDRVQLVQSGQACSEWLTLNSPVKA